MSEDKNLSTATKTRSVTNTQLLVATAVMLAAGGVALAAAGLGGFKTPGAYYTCADSDGGINLMEAGYINTTNQRTGESQVFNDRCQKNGRVLEFYCKENRKNSVPMQTAVACPKDLKCSEGACVPKKPCTDSDGGENIYEKGTADGIPNPSNPFPLEGYRDYTDFCSTDKTVVEFYCNASGYVTGQATYCEGEYGCNDGACRPISATSTVTPDLAFYNDTPRFTHDNGTPYTLYVTIVNNGPADYVPPQYADQHVVVATWYDADGQPLTYPENRNDRTDKTRQWLSLPLGEGRTENLAFPIIPDRRARSVQIEIDPENKLIETREDNNTERLAIPETFVLPIDPTESHTCADVDAIPLIANKYRSVCSSYEAVCYNKYSLAYLGCGGADGVGCSSRGTNDNWIRNMVCPTAMTSTTSSADSGYVALNLNGAGVITPGARSNLLNFYIDNSYNAHDVKLEEITVSFNLQPRSASGEVEGFDTDFSLVSPGFSTSTESIELVRGQIQKTDWSTSRDFKKTFSVSLVIPAGAQKTLWLLMDIPSELSSEYYSMEAGVTVPMRFTDMTTRDAVPAVPPVLYTLSFFP